MSRKVIDKLRQVTNAARTSFFKPKTPQEGKQDPIKEDANQDERKDESRFKKFTNLAQEKLRSINSPQLDSMKEKLKQLNPSKKLKDIQINNSLKDGANKLKQGSQSIVSSLKDRASKLSGKFQNTKQQVSSAMNKLTPSLPQKDKQANKWFQLEKGKEESKQQQMMKWFTKQMHNSQANFKALQDMIQKELKNNATSRFGMVQKVFQKLYWKMVILLFFICFAYGLGSSIPREIRKYYDNSDRKQARQEKQLKQGKEIKA